MAKGVKGSRFHPARVSGEAKFLLKKAVDAMTGKKRESKIEPLDTSKPNWSTRKK